MEIGGRKEKANKVERAAALTAEMEGQSEKISVVCDHSLEPF